MSNRRFRLAAVLLAAVIAVSLPAITADAASQFGFVSTIGSFLGFESTETPVNQAAADDTSFLDDPNPDSTTLTWSSSTTGTAYMNAANWTGNPGKFPGVDANLNSTADGAEDDIASIGVLGFSGNSIGINFTNNTNTGVTVNTGANGSLRLGAINFLSTTSKFLNIGSNASSNGVLTLNGATISSVNNVVVASASTFNHSLNPNVSNTGIMSIELGNSLENVVLITNSGSITINAVITGSGRKLVKDGSGDGVLNLSGTNTYSGDTEIRAGSLALAGTGSLANSPKIIIHGNAFFDVSTRPGGLTLSAGQGISAPGSTTSGSIVTSGSTPLVLASDSPIGFSSFNGSVAPLTVRSSGTLNLQPGNPVAVSVSNGGTPLGIGSYKLIAKSGTASVSGTPSSLTVAGDGICSGCTASLSNISGELFMVVDLPPVCPAGTWWNGTSCVAASPGYYVPTPGATSQTPCAIGTYQPSSGAISCILAPAGSFVSTIASASATPCSPGTYQPSTGQSSCINASPGNFVGGSGATSQSPCPAGTYQPGSGASSCIPAPAGFFVPAPAAASATPCPLGRYQPSTGQTSCLLASAGNFVGSTGQSTQTPCAAGSYQPNTGQSSCINASPGNYVALTGAIEQIPCPVGMYQPDAGQSGCILASPGYFVFFIGQSAQTPCSPGTYQPNSGQDTCMNAGPGHFVSGTAAAAQTPCSAGTYQPASGATSCIVSDPGYYVPDPGATSQIICPPGTTSGAGATFCSAITTYQLTVIIDGSSTGTGTVTSVPAGINCSSGTCTAVFADGTNVTLIATPDTGSSFFAWTSGDCTGTGTCSLTMNGNKTATANFASASPPEVQFDAAVIREDEAQSIEVGVIRTGDTSGTSSVDVEIYNPPARPGAKRSAGGPAGEGTLATPATAGADCSTAGVDIEFGGPVTLTFAPGETYQSITMPLCSDLIDEGLEYIEFTLTDNVNTDVGTPFVVTVYINDTANQWFNFSSIGLPSSGDPPAEYPSEITVTGAPTSIGSIRVTLFGVWLSDPTDLEVMLRGPNGVMYVLMADTGGTSPILSSDAVTLTFRDSATSIISPTAAPTTGVYLPTTCGTAGPFPPPAPSGTYNLPGCSTSRTVAEALFGSFGLTDGNGTWQLYVRGDNGAPLGPEGLSGEIAGWGLELLAPTAAGVEVSGRVLTPDGRGLRNAAVTMTDSNGITRTTVTSSFGYYRFEGVPVGDSFVMSVNSRSYRFVPRVVLVTDTLTDVDFVGLE